MIKRVGAFQPEVLYIRSRRKNRLLDGIESRQKSIATK